MPDAVASAKTTSSFVLETKDLRKSFQVGEQRVEALRGVNLQVSPGEMVAIRGPSGCGKSTLLTLLGAVDIPTQGSVFLEDTDLATLSDQQRTLIRRRRIGFVFQAFNLLPILTALQNVSLPLELDGLATVAANQRALTALQQVGMEHRADHLPTMLSGGEQQRVAIARAMIARPAILLADEPTGNLDSANSQRIMDLLLQLVREQQQTLVMVTHDPEVSRLADRMIFLRDGQIERVEGTGDFEPLQSPRRAAGGRE